MSLTILNNVAAFLERLPTLPGGIVNAGEAHSWSEAHRFVTASLESVKREMADAEMKKRVEEEVKKFTPPSAPDAPLPLAASHD